MIKAGQITRGKVFLVILPSQEIQKNIDSIVTRLVKRDKTAIVYISFNKPYNVLSKNWKNKKIDLDKILCIDCITAGAIEKQNGKNVIYDLSPNSLTAISLAISAFLKTAKGKKAIIMDSLSTLLIYNELNMVARFTNDLVEKARASDTKAIIFTTKHEELLGKVSLFFDKIIQ